MIVFLFSFFLNGLAVFALAKLMPGVAIDAVGASLALAAAIGLINALIRPAIHAICLPVNILTVSIATFLISALVILFAAQFVPGFTVDSYLHTAIFALVLAIINGLVHSFAFYY